MDMNNEHSRDYFGKSGLQYGDLTKQSILRLRDLIDREMTNTKLFRGTFKCNLEIEFNGYDENGNFWAGITCRSDYFDKREAVSFNRDGFIGFAGWASTGNTKPILDGFIKWVDEMRMSKNNVTGGNRGMGYSGGQLVYV